MTVGVLMKMVYLDLYCDIKIKTMVNSMIIKCITHNNNVWLELMMIKVIPMDEVVGALFDENVRRAGIAELGWRITGVISTFAEGKTDFFLDINSLHLLLAFCVVSIGEQSLINNCLGATSSGLWKPSIHKDWSTTWKHSIL